MKRIIQSFLIFTVAVSAWGAPLPERCKMVLRHNTAASRISLGDYSTQNPEFQKKEIVETLLGQLKEIMELKFKLSDYLEENREVYGQYSALGVRKEELAMSISRYETQRAEVITKYNLAVKSLNPEHRRTILKRILEQLKVDKEQDLGRIDRELHMLYNERSEVDSRFVEVSTIWSPYQEYLGQIQDLERSLLETLEVLRKVEVIEEETKSSVDYLATYLRTSKSPLEDGYTIERDCEALFDQVKKLVRDRVLGGSNIQPRF